MTISQDCLTVLCAHAQKHGNTAALETYLPQLDKNERDRMAAYWAASAPDRMTPIVASVRPSE